MARRSNARTNLRTRTQAGGGWEEFNPQTHPDGVQFYTIRDRVGENEVASSFVPVDEDREIAAMVPWRFYVKRLEDGSYEMAGQAQPVEE